jgi:adenosylcobinamide-phosphate synthase
MGRSLALVERALRRIGLDGYGGGILLFVVLALVWSVFLPMFIVLLSSQQYGIGVALHLFLLYSLLALGSLLQHGRRIENALRDDDLPRARAAVSQLVGRDTEPLDAGGCRRAAVESLSENLTDAVVSPLLWYVVGGLPLLLLFKVVSTMDSMVGYKTPRYLRFGWCGARLDDVMNYVPARVTWLLVGAAATVVPGCSPARALRVGLSQHGLLPSPNSGWSEAATAGAVRRRLVGPIWNAGRLVTDIWIGIPSDPPLTTSDDYDRAARVVGVAAGFAAALAIAAAHMRARL